ncbi:site-specific integrase [Longispora albida]|uniref:site-specific integrase n=1 Tax=Longispora albida TaxID=203523 RepID=UPI00035EDFB9|nr:tyrosine-type recombinase/integrase [Longispora albida]
MSQKSTSQKKPRRAKGEGSIYQRSSDGLWVAAIDVGYVAGKRQRAVGYGATQEEAIEERDRIRDQKKAGLDLTKKPKTVADWLDEWLLIKAEEERSPSTLDRYRSVVDVHLRPGLGSVRLDKLTAKRIRQFLAGYKGKRSPATILKIHAVLRAALSGAMAEDLLTRNVAKSVTPGGGSRDERRALTPDEAKTFLRAIKGDRLESVFLLAIATGLRRSELLGLRWSDVDLDGEALWVRQKLIRSSQGLTIGSPKTHRSKRPIPLQRVGLLALRRQKARLAEERLAAGEAWKPEYDLVFPNTLGKPMEPRNVNRRFEKYRAAAGLDWLDLHDLRHAFATFLLDAGEELRTVMDLLGHSTIRLTADLYGHVLAPRAREAAKGIDQALGNLA